MTNWRDTIMTHTEMCDRIDELEAENKALASRLDKAEKRIALNDDYATSRLCPDHRGKWMRGRCVLCELEAAESRLDRIPYLTALVASAYSTLNEARHHPQYEAFGLGKSVIETARDLLHKALYGDVATMTDADINAVKVELLTSTVVEKGGL